MATNPSVQDEGLLSDDRLQDWLNGELHRFLSVERAMTREQLASAAGVNIHTLDAIRKSDIGRRKPTPSVMLSLCLVMGPRRVNGLLANIGYGGAKPLDEADELNVNALVATGLTAFSTIATACADGRIDHLEAPRCREAADQIIATVMPLSSAAEAA